jgi:hypothetical protein
MRLRFDGNEKQLTINSDQNFKLDAGWNNAFQTYEREILEELINPIENYETCRFIHKPYTSNGLTQSDIWYYFYFVDGNNTYTNGLDYNLIGVNQNLSDLKKCFFKLEFYKTPDNEIPDRSNRRLVFSKTLNPVFGERSLINSGQKLYVPVFKGTPLKNKECMNLFWFEDDTVLEESVLTGLTFFMTAKFYNGVDGSITQFVNKPNVMSSTLNEGDDLYFEVVMDRSTSPSFNYTVSEYSTFGRGGIRGTTSSPIKFYEIGGNVGSGNTPTPTPSSTTVLTPTPSSTVVLTPTPSTTTTTLSWSNGSSMNHSETLPGDNPSTGTTTGTLTVTNGPANLYITVTHQTGFDNIGYGSISVNGVGSISTQTVPSNQSSTSLPSTLTVPTGTYTYTITSILTITGSNQFGVISTSVSNQ